ncbi:hypothetical protein [Pedobacter sp. SYP-B3415]|uniref:hypothetical protein n=1 Tax=Pedobacter sp. SYP-B3415 TaxID=2496641 RepID=UPI00101BD020|nr:hypothetical protein [Pedobacter sp. SYP-B3415]
MTDQQEQISALKDIRKMMERSSRFISLSGLSGVGAGISALVGAFLAQRELDRFGNSRFGDARAYAPGVSGETDLEFNLICIALGVLVAALSSGFLFTWLRARRGGLPLWDRTTRNMLVNLFIPLFAGGCFVLSLLVNNSGLVAPACLIFYGLSLINASKYTLTDIRYLGFLEVILGIINLIFPALGLIFWTIGFGILHILYGTVMYFKYERKST